MDESKVRLDSNVRAELQDDALAGAFDTKAVTVELSEEKRMELENFLGGRIKDIQTRRQEDLLDLDKYRSTLRGVRRKAPLRQGMSNLSVPLTLWASAAVRARVEQSVLDAKPLVIATPVGRTKDDAGTDLSRVAADLGRWMEAEIRSPRALNGESAIRRAVAELVNIGPCALKVYRELPKVRLLPDAKGKPIAQTVERGRIKWAHICVEDLLWCDGYGWDTQAMPVVGHEFERTWAQIQFMRAAGWYSADAVAAIEGHYEKLQDSDPAPLRTHKLAELYLDFVTNDAQGIPVPLIVDFHLDSGKAMWVRWNRQAQGRRPIYMTGFDFDPDLKRGMAQGLCAKLAGAQDETDVMHNLGVEALKRAIAHLTIIKAGTGAADDLGGSDPILPGDKVVTENPAEDVVTVPLGKPEGVQAWLAGEANTLRYVFRMLGFDESGLGQVEAGKRVPASLGLTTMREGRVITKQPINSLGDLLSEMIYHTLELYRDSMPDDTLYATLAPEAATAVRNMIFSSNEATLRSQFVIVVNAQDAAIAQETKKQEIMVVNQVLGAYYDKLIQYATMAAQVPPPLQRAILAIAEKLEAGVRALLTTIDSIPNPDEVLIRVAEYTQQLEAMTAGAAGSTGASAAPGAPAMLPETEEPAFAKEEL